VDEKLSEVLGKDGSSLLYISILNMSAFREAYGFVASDDVLRAVSLMVVNTMREFSRPEDFLGHLSATEFILVVPPSNLAALSDKLQSRLDQSVEYFYPIKDREQASKRSDRLGAKLFEISSLKNQTDVAQFKAELLNSKN
jgi:GGDEF domain-containing protein